MERKKYLYQADYPESIALEKIWFTDRKATKQANYCAQRACTFALFLTFRNNNYYDSKIFVVIFHLYNVLTFLFYEISLQPSLMSKI